MECHNYLYKIRTCKHDAFLWTIDKSYKDMGVGDVIQSHTFTIEEDFDWQLQFYPKSDNQDFQDYFSVYLKSMNEEDVSIRFSCSVLNDRSEVFCTSGMQVATFSPEMSIGVKKLVKSNQVNNEIYGEVAVKGDLRLLCEIWFDDDKPLDNKTKSNTDFDFEKLVNNEIFSDVKFSIEGRIIYAHRMILANKSAVFGVMFDHTNYSSKQTDPIIIENIEYDVMAELIRYIYCGRTTDIRNKAKKLISVAFKYGVTDMMPVCEKSLIETLSISNVFDILALTNHVGGQKLKQKALSFIAAHAKDLSKTGQFQYLRYIHIDDAFEIISQLVKKLED